MQKCIKITERYDRNGNAHQVIVDEVQYLEHDGYTNSRGEHMSADALILSDRHVVVSGWSRTLRQSLVVECALFALDNVEYEWAYKVAQTYLTPEGCDTFVREYLQPWLEAQALKYSQAIPARFHSHVTDPAYAVMRLRAGLDIRSNRTGDFLNLNQ